MVKKMMRKMDKKRAMSSMKGHDMYVGVPILILGALILSNVYWQLFSWPAFVGWVLLLAGFLKLIMHKK